MKMTKRTYDTLEENAAAKVKEGIDHAVMERLAVLQEDEVLALWREAQRIARLTPTGPRKVRRRINGLTRMVPINSL
jgi:hypothetical protein